MKKYLLTGALITITATTLYATTAGSTVVDKMKAAVHAFTLTTDLNAGQTGLTSEPVKGKKTGDILTAGEYNRILELVAGGGSGISDVELVTSQAASPLAAADYTHRVSLASCPAGKKVISGGCSYPDTLNTFVHNTPTPDLTGWLCGGLHHDGDTTINAAKYPTRPTAYAICGTYGSGGGGSGSTSAGWVDVSLTGTDPFDEQCMYRIRSLNQVYYANVVHSGRIYWYSTGSWNIYVDKSDKTAFVDDSANPNLTVTKIEKLCGGGGASTSTTCPTGFVAVGSFCIEPTMNATNKDWYEAALACTEKGAQLCHWSEWSAACQKGVLTDVVFGASGKYEWIDDYSIANQGIADPIVYSNCKYLSRQADGTKAANTAYRCCAPKQ